MRIHAVRLKSSKGLFYSTQLSTLLNCFNTTAGVHEAFKASVRSTNSKLLHSSHDSASSLHQTQVNQNASVSRLNPANLRAIEESSALTADPSRIGSNLGRHARRILEAAHLSSSAPPSATSQRAQSNASTSSTDTAAHTTASSLFSSVRSPVNNPAAAAVRKLTAGLKATLQELFGATLHLSASTVAMTFPTAFDRLHVSFYRSKITSWMAAQEEDYRCLYPCFCNECLNTKCMDLYMLKYQYIISDSDILLDRFTVMSNAWL